MSLGCIPSSWVGSLHLKLTDPTALLGTDGTRKIGSIPFYGRHHLSGSVTLEKKGNPFWGLDHFSGAATKKKGKREPLNN